MVGQTMVEFAMVAPLFFLVVLATIDFGGYFGARLGVEEAARAGARAASVQVVSSYSGSTITTAISAQRGLADLTTNVDCQWEGTTLDPSQYPPFTFSGSGCIGIWYFDMGDEINGPPTLCAEWSVAGYWDTWYDGTEYTDQSSPDPGGTKGLSSGCVVPLATAASQENIVVVGVGYKYTPLTPMPTIVSGALTTYGETQILEEGVS
jgi:hypothetical protein